MILIPVFAGRTSSGELYVLYREDKDLEVVPKPFNNSREIDPPEAFHLRLPDGEVHALAPGSKLTMWGDTDINRSHMKIQSEVWTGELHGSKLDLMEEKILDRNR